MKKKFCASSVVRQMDEAVTDYNANHKLEITSDNNVHLARVILISKQSSKENMPARKKSADNLKAPFLCFMRRASRNKTVIIGLETGKALVVSNHSLVIKHKDMDSFSLRGIRYKMKDCVNGLPRFTVAHAAPHSAKAKIEEIDF